MDSLLDQIAAVAADIGDGAFPVPAVENTEPLEVEAVVPVLGAGFITTRDRSGTTLHLTVSEQFGMSWAVNGKEATRVPDAALVVRMVEGKLRLMEAGALRQCRFHTAATCAAMARNIRADGCVR
jgi:hypothetical protein